VTFLRITPWKCRMPACHLDRCKRSSMKCLILFSLLLGCRGESKPALIKGVSYGPVPLKHLAGGQSLLAQDDWMVEAAKPMWGERGRDDLHVMKQLGANMVRLYGNNPNQSHHSFLDKAHQLGMQVVPGMSDYPFIQMPDQKCMDTDYDCFNQSRDLYALNLETGFLTDSKEYHPALAYFIVINEPDLKMPPAATTTPGGPRQMVKAVVSALDGLLEAEKEANVSGILINFTATFSYAVCLACDELNYAPALGQMAILEDAMLHPEQYGYEPRNNVSEAYLTRWTQSFNTNNPARDLEPQFFSKYPARFPSTPVFVAEYHSPILAYLRPPMTLEEDLEQALSLANSSDLFLGIFFFQYQMAYWKGGSEENFGLFGLGDYRVAEMPYYGTTYDVWCLQPRVTSSTPDSSMSQVLTKVYEGPGLDYEFLCKPNPASVAISADGFRDIVSQGAARLAVFAKRVVEHLGAVVSSDSGLRSFSASMVNKSYADLVIAISHKPAWTSFSSSAACVADRTADAGQVGAAISWLCGHTPGFSCEVPESCASDAFSTGDWLFSRWYQQVGRDPLMDCNFGGAAIFASPALRGDTPCSARLRRLGTVLV
ncbi:unnamed protein product, partial [Effrenium voratum]